MTENNAAAGKAQQDEIAGGQADGLGDDVPGSDGEGNDVPGDRESDRGAAPDTAEALRKQADENWNRYLRSVAELENLRKRSARELENARRYGAERLVGGILPVLDSLEAGLKAAQEADPEALDIATLLEGEQATLRLLEQALEDAGVTPIDPEGEPFDPKRHEAMSMLPSETAEPNSVIAVVQKGYALNDRIVRPARVVVAMAPPDAEPGAGA